jgi:hypothetical protein
MSINVEDFNIFDERELRLIKNCINYTNNDPAGLPGHNLLVIVAKLMKMLENPSDSYIETVIREVLTRSGYSIDDLDLNDFVDLLGE